MPTRNPAAPGELIDTRAARKPPSTFCHGRSARRSTLSPEGNARAKPTALRRRLVADLSPGDTRADLRLTRCASAAEGAASAMRCTVAESGSRSAAAADGGAATAVGG